jgi:TPR repeat protein
MGTLLMRANTILQGVLIPLFLLAGMQSPLLASEMWEELFDEHLENARAGDTEAQYELGIMYLKGQGVEQDREQALLWLQKASDGGDQQATSKLSRVKKEQEKFEELSASAQTGDIDAQYEVAMMYLKGRGVHQSGKQARKWLGKAAEQGDARAITRLGIVNYKGEDGPIDYPQALELFNRVSGTSALAQYYLGEIYANGSGVEQDYPVAIDWYKKAAEGGFDRALGKIINLEEELRVRELRQGQIAQAKLREQEAAADAALAKQKQAAEKKSADNTRRTAPGKKTPVVIKIKQSPLDRLAGQHWFRGEKPLEYLPSQLTECDRENDGLVCLSKELIRDQGVQVVRYRVKSVINSENGGFAIVYRNLVLDVEDLQDAEDESLGAGYDGEVEHGFKVRTGWTQEHFVNCKSSSLKQLDCIKDQAHKMQLVSKSE